MTKNVDPFLILKNVGFLRSQLPGKDSGITSFDYIAYARHHLCNKRNVLFLDPIWDRYSNEDILVEFFATQFDENEEFRNEFFKQLNDGKSEEENWFRTMEEKYKKAREEEVKVAMGGKDEFSDTFGK